jgi:DNA-directed RNA polymerase I, II, and III subunit RPABC1
MSHSGFVIKIVKARNTILEILNDLNYNVDNYNGFSSGEINTMIKENQLDMLISHKNDNKKIYIKFHLGKSLRPNNIFNFVEDLYNIDENLTKNDDLLIIAIDKANNSIETTINQLWIDEKIYVRVLGIEHLQFNILKHSLVPNHKILSDQEKKDVFKKYNIQNEKQIPDISRFSPVSLVIGLRPGELCEITRPSKTAIDTLFYRICSN